MKDLLLRLGFTYSLARASKESKKVSGEYKLIYFDLQLTEQVEFLTKKLYGSSSEKTKVDPNQLSLFEDPHLENHQTNIEPTEEITYRPRKASGRKAEVTKDLTVEEIHCELHGEDCMCDHCGQEMKPMGKKVIREEVYFILAK